MAVYMIGYDLNKDKDYNELYDAIKSSYPTYWHHLDSTWLVDTTNDAKTIKEKIKPHIDDDDSLLIMRVTSDYSGWLTEKAWKWIKDRDY